MNKSSSKFLSRNAVLWLGSFWIRCYFRGKTDITFIARSTGSRCPYGSQCCSFPFPPRNTQHLIPAIFVVSSSIAPTLFLLELIIFDSFKKNRNGSLFSLYNVNRTVISNLIRFYFSSGFLGNTILDVPSSPSSLFIVLQLLSYFYRVYVCTRQLISFVALWVSKH